MGAGASVETISPQAVGENVASLGAAYEKYRSVIEENGFSGEILADINSDQDLEAMLESIGITNLLHKKNLVKQFHKWKDGGSTPGSGGGSTGGGGSSETRTSSKSYNIAFQDNITIPPKDIMSEMFQIQGIPLDPQDLEPAGQAIYQAVKERCNSSNQGMLYDCFIGYRVFSESDVAEKLYLLLKLKGLNPFWDKKCLAKGEDWKEAFLKGLQCSKCYVSLISSKALSPCRDRLKDHSFDNYLLEMQLGMKIRQEINNPSFIIPIHIGEYMNIAGEGMILKKFRDFDCNLYSPCITISKPARASILAQQAEEKAESSRSLGRKNYSDGYYEGELVNDQRIGYGVVEITSGESKGFYYAGEWKNDTQYGYGVSHSTLTVMKGLSYAGEWKDGNWEGYGIRTFPEGVCMEGEFKDSEFVMPPPAPEDATNNANTLTFPVASDDEEKEKFRAYTKVQNTPKVIFSTLFKPFVAQNAGYTMIDWDPEEPDYALQKTSKIVSKAPNMLEAKYDCIIIYRKECVNDLTIATTLNRFLDTNGDGSTVYPLDYYKFGPNQRQAQKEELENAMKSVKSAIVIISNKAVEPCQSQVISHVDDQYLMQIEAVLRTATKADPKAFTVLPILVGEYFDIEKYGHVLQKFRSFDGSLYAETIDVSEAGKAAYYAREAAQKAKSLENPESLTYDDGGVYVGEFGSNQSKEGLGIYKVASLHTFYDDWLKWFANSVYEGEFKDNCAHGYGVLTYKWYGTYEGAWKNGRKHGFGIRYFPHGVKIEGRWVDDVFQQ